MTFVLAVKTKYNHGDARKATWPDDYLGSDRMDYTCRFCGAPATVRHEALIECTADPSHIDFIVDDNGQVTFRRAPGWWKPRPRPEGLTEGEQMAVGWARKHQARWGERGRNWAEAMRKQFPWLDDAELTRIALFFGHTLEHIHMFGESDLDVIGLAQVIKAAAVELAELETTYPEWPDPQ